MQKGKSSIEFENGPRIIGHASVVGKKEGEGPLGNLFDFVEKDPMFGTKTWEEAESRLQKITAETAIHKAGLAPEDIRYLLAGDLLGQLIATSFGVMELQIPLFGLYGACSTMGEAMMLGAILVDGGYADRVLSMASSHFASARVLSHTRWHLKERVSHPVSTRNALKGERQLPKSLNATHLT